MNIDTTNVSTNNDIKSNIMSSQVSKLTGNNGFKSQLSSLSSSSAQNSDTETSLKTQTDDVSSNINEDNSSDDDKKVDTKGDEKTQNAENKHDNSVKNDENQQKQGQNGSQNNNQNQASAELSDEINSMLKLNGKITDISQLQNQRFITGINEDVYTSAPALDYSKISMSSDDAVFFANLVTKTDMSMQSIAGEFQKSLNSGNVQNVQKTAKVSSALLEALSDSMKTNKSFRIDFDKDVSVVMRVDRDGNINANFIPGDKAVEAYLRNNISYLRQRFDEQNLPYNELSYSKHRRQDQEEEKRNNKENNNE